MTANTTPIETGVILVVDDEPQIHRFLTPALTAAGYTPLRAERGADALKLAATRVPDVILLDLGLPDIDGHFVLARLREFSDAPVIVLSARDREADKIAALDAGANDYVEKPFGLGELLARIRNALRIRHARALDGELLAIGGLSIDAGGHRALLNGTDLGLTNKQYDLLAVFVRNKARVLTHRQILTAVWGAGHTEDQAYLRIYVSQLRRKLLEAGADVAIETAPGTGYRLVEVSPKAP
jgi:two-component system, OmpR family, KDP operon response regulator KdpE